MDSAAPGAAPAGIRTIWAVEPRPIQGRIELRNVSFRYAETERFVLENVSLKVEAGQFVTIMGPSGGGKTTLLKIMLGLLEPTSGEVLIDGVPLQTIGVRVYREQVAAVMQEDQLLSGSIAVNARTAVPSFQWPYCIRETTATSGRSITAWWTSCDSPPNISPRADSTT